MSVNVAVPGGFPDDGWRRWLLYSRGARRCSSVLITAEASAAAVAFAVSAKGLLTDRAIPGLTLLLVPAVPILAAGQGWMIAWMNLRQGSRTGSWRQRRNASTDQLRWPNPRTLFFGKVDPRIGNGLFALAFTGWLLGITAFPAIAAGGPAGSGGGCAYRLDSHGSYTCVSERAYQHAGAGEQRFAASIMLAFFAVQTGAALGGRRLQQEASA